MYPKIPQSLLRHNSTDVMQGCFLTGPLNFDSSLISLLELVPNQIHVAPFIAMDFSMANLTFTGREISTHTQDLRKANQYRDILHMMSSRIYSGELYLPVFGYGAKTFPASAETA